VNAAAEADKKVEAMQADFAAKQAEFEASAEKTEAAMKATEEMEAQLSVATAELTEKNATIEALTAENASLKNLEGTTGAIITAEKETPAAEGEDDDEKEQAKLASMSIAERMEYRKK